MQLLLFWATSLCPHPRPPGWMGSQSLVHLEGHSGITQGHCYSSGFLGKDPEFFQTLAQPEKDQSRIPNQDSRPVLHTLTPATLSPDPCSSSLGSRLKPPAFP